MLNDAPLHRPAPAPRRRVLALAWWPNVRGMDVRTLAAVVAGALAPALVAALRGDEDFSGPLLIAALVLGAAVALAVDDAAEETLSASPTSRAARRVIRVSAIAGGTALVLGAVIAIATATGQVTAAEVGRRAVELAAVAALSAGLAGWGQRLGLPGAVHGGAVAGVMTVLVISAMAFRYDWLPSINGPFHHDRWWWIVAAGGALTAWTWRDPARQ